MAVLPRKRHLSPKASRALEFLANRPASVTVALLLARGFSRRMLFGSIRQRLATLTYEKAQTRGRIIEIGKMQITAAGRNALAAED